jgi:hypothetical protein
MVEHEAGVDAARWRSFGFEREPKVPTMPTELLFVVVIWHFSRSIAGRS